MFRELFYFRAGRANSSESDNLKARHRHVIGSVFHIFSIYFYRFSS